MGATIVTLGGGGFSDSDDGTSLLDDYLLELVGKPDPRVCFVGTASGDPISYWEHFVKSFEHRGRLSALTLFPSDAQPYSEPSLLLDQDLIYVGGGSTANLLALWRLHGVHELMIEAASRGTVLAGVSAGMNCWFEASSTDSFGPLAPLADGLGLLPGSCCPHYLDEADRRALFQEWVREEQLPSGHAATDGVALVWRDGELAEAVSDRPDGKAFRVTPDGETSLEVRQLAT